MDSEPRNGVIGRVLRRSCEYFTFPDGTENEHIVIGRVIGGAGLKRKISTGKMRRKLVRVPRVQQQKVIRLRL